MATTILDANTLPSTFGFKTQMSEPESGKSKPKEEKCAEKRIERESWIKAKLARHICAVRRFKRNKRYQKQGPHHAQKEWYGLSCISCEICKNGSCTMNKKYFRIEIEKDSLGSVVLPTGLMNFGLTGKTSGIEICWKRRYFIWEELYQN